MRWVLLLVLVSRRRATSTRNRSTRATGTLRFLLPRRLETVSGPFVAALCPACEVTPHFLHLSSYNRKNDSDQPPFILGDGVNAWPTISRGEKSLRNETIHVANTMGWGVLRSGDWKLFKSTMHSKQQKYQGFW